MSAVERIDMHAHGFPEAYLRSLCTHYPQQARLAAPTAERPLTAYWARAPLPAWDLECRVQEMERDGVQTEVLSAPTVYTHLDEQGALHCRMLNDFQAELAQQFPGRFLSMLHLPVHKTAEALAELARWDGHAAVAGVVFGSNMGGIYPGDESMLPIWDAIEARRLTVLVHPVTPPALYGPVTPTILQFPLDSATAAASIIYSGLFERRPGLRIIIPHLGGVLPFLATRLDMALDIPGFPPGHGQQLPRRPSEYVECFHYDLAQCFARPAFTCACSVAGVERLVYGSDHFFVGSRWRAQLNAFIDDLGLSPAERRAILRGNAERLIDHG